VGWVSQAVGWVSTKRCKNLRGERGEGGREQTGHSRSTIRSHACVASKRRAPWRWRAMSGLASSRARR